MSRRLSRKGAWHGRRTQSLCLTWYGNNMRAFIWLVISSGCLLASGDQAGRRAPGFALPDPEYKHFYDLQDYRGKGVLIDIMSTRCPHCQLLTTTLEQVKARYGDKVAILEVVLPRTTKTRFPSMSGV